MPPRRGRGPRPGPSPLVGAHLFRPRVAAAAAPSAAIAAVTAAAARVPAAVALVIALHC